MPADGDVPRTWPAPIHEDGITVEAVNFEILDVSEDGTRTLRVWVMWDDTLRFADVSIDRETWEAAERGDADADR